MKRFAFFLGTLLALPAFGEVAPVFYDDIDTVEYGDVDYEDEEYILVNADEIEEVVAPKSSVVASPRTVSGGRATPNRSTSARVVPTKAAPASTRGTAANVNRVVAARTAAVGRARTGLGGSERGAISRAASRPAARTAVARGTTARQGLVPAPQVNATRNATTTNNVVARAATNKITSISGSGPSLYNPNDVARVGIRTNSSTSRTPIVRIASSGATTESAAISASEMDELTEMTDYCKAQYAACMDNYCNVLDSEQGRCICSSNLKNYAKTEEALKKATAELQEVAQKFQYIGLSAREVEQLFSQTEAELTMQGKTDTTQMKTNLDKIKDMIVNVQSGSSSSSTGVSFDLSGLLDFSIDSMGFDLNSFLGGTNTSSVSNQRGEELFKTASARCKTNVLNSCAAQGVDISIVTNSYDLGIDQACMAYERSLNDSNDQMLATIRNAKTVLQRARLLVAQQKNEYDMRQCITQLDACMQDDFVCGADYENCLDPTGQYIVKGNIVVGSAPGSTTNSSSSIYNTWKYDNDNYNAWGTGGTLAAYINATVSSNSAESTSENMSKYLQNKIGYVKKENNNNVNYGMCVSVLNKCQDYTYSGTGSNVNYRQDNDVIKQYLGRVLVQIKARQDEVLADYAEKCSTDVAACLNQNGYPTVKPGVDGWSDPRETVALAACDSVLTTCVSVNGKNPNGQNVKKCWARSVQFSDYNDCNSDMTPAQSSSNTGATTSPNSD